MSWIDVNKRLPKDGKKVVILKRESGEMAFARYHKGVGFYRTDFGFKVYMCNVTHWIPMPEPIPPQNSSSDTSQ